MIHNKLIDLADELYSELSSPTDISLSSITYWLRSHVGTLNNLLNTEYEIDATTLDLTEDVGELEKVVWKKLFFIYYSSKSIQSNLGSAAYNVISYRADGAEIRRVDKNSVAKSFLELRGQYQNELDQLVNSYKLKKALPLALDGADIYSPFPFVRQPGFSRQGDSNI